MFQSGRIVAGHVLEAELGRGGMGVVYRARDQKLDRLVALKMVLAGAHAGSDGLMRFLSEARSAAGLVHPNIVQVYEIGEQDGLPYFTQEYVPGGSLAARLVQLPPTPGQAARVVDLLARAVEHAHRHGVIHRDLKPANVLLVEGKETPLERCTPKVADFGLARRVEGGDELTLSGAVMGSPSYMSPEQAAGHTRDVGPTADVYALGAILYEMLTGRPPFRGATASETLIQVRTLEVVPVRKLQPEVPRDLETICHRCLHKDPGRRFLSAQALADDLERFLAGRPILSRPVGRLERGWRWCRRNPALASLLGVLLILAAVSASLITWQWRSAVAALARADQEQRARTLAQVNALREAAADAVPDLLRELDQGGELVQARLRELWQEDGSRARQMRLALALIRAEPESETLREALFAWMLQAEDPAEVLLAREALRPQKHQLVERLWAIDTGKPGTPEQFRALVGLAAFAPADRRWKSASERVVEHLLTTNALHLSRWAEGLHPVRLSLLPPLGQVFRGERLGEQRQVAANVLARYAADLPDVLVELLLDADSRQYGVLLPAVLPHQEQVLPALRAELKRADRPTRTFAQADAAASRRANAAITLSRLGQHEALGALLTERADPGSRTQLLHRFQAQGGSLREVLRRLEAARDPFEKQGLYLVLGEFPRQEVPAEEWARLRPLLLRAYRSEGDAGVHSALDWLLSRWGDDAELRKIDAHLATAQRTQQRDWYVNSQGQTLAIVRGPVEFTMGSPETEKGRHQIEQQHRRRIARSFAIATREVTASEFRRFLQENPNIRYLDEEQKKYGPDGRCPALGVTWLEAAAYCRWLSEKEEHDSDEMCYPEQGKIKEGMELPANYLERTGYRLPTEAEWEYACRAGTTTPWSHGISESLIGQYGWHLRNSVDPEGERTRPVGRLRPNFLGLFDIQGNVHEWCQDRGTPYPIRPGGGVVLDGEDPVRVVIDRDVRIYRGGCFIDLPVLLRSASRDSARPTTRIGNVGLRIARTYPTQ